VTPTLRFLRLLAAWALLGVIASVWAPAVLGWQVVGVVLGVGAVVDALLGWMQKRITAVRSMPGRFALGISQEIELRLHNPGGLLVKVEVFDGIPPTVESPHLPWTGTIAPRAHTTLLYTATAFQRGEASFSRTHVRHFSPLGLWTRSYFSGEAAKTRVYPNYEPVVRYTLLAVAHRESQMGIVAKNRAGQSRDFHQLREYQDGDVLSQVDWKATARRGQLVSRQYREQRDQTIILLLDCGRRLRALDGEVTQFDHCLNASLLLSYIALRQGDNVGAMSFGGTDRWLPPVRGQHSMNVLLNHLYDYECTLTASDFGEAAERIMARQRRRALIVLLTNLRGEEGNHLIAPLRLLGRRHLLVVASLRERSVMDKLAEPVTNFEGALSHAAGVGYLAQRAALLATLRDHKVLTVDETAQQLAGALASTYLDVKQRGVL
jgi:uncharacterized protein (DUF58 family)